MSINIINKNGIVNCSYLSIDNLYTGKQYNCSNGKLTYNYATDIFKLYGFDTCTRLDPVENPNYSNSETKTFMTYSYLLDSTVQYELEQEYIISLYAYVSEDCNANFKLVLEHSNTWVSNYQSTTKNIEDSTKGKVIWIWGKCKACSNDGKIYCMFYPNQNQADVFTQGYQLFAGITIYKGTELLRPMNNNISGSGFIESSTPPRQKLGKTIFLRKNLSKSKIFYKGGVINVY